MTDKAPDLSIALYQPDIPQNVGAMIRLCACMRIALEVIEPCGFLWKKRDMDKVAMDYGQYVDMRKHSSWGVYKKQMSTRRSILLTTKAEYNFFDFEFQPGDILLAGRESAGVPPDVHDSVDARITIPMAGGARSMNIVNATAMVLGEALRQVRWHNTL